MSAALPTNTPAGTPVWVLVGENLWLAGTTTAEPYDLPDGSRYGNVEVHLGRGPCDMYDYPLSRVQRRRVR